MSVSELRAPRGLLTPARSAELIRTELEAGNTDVAIRVMTEMAGRLQLAADDDLSELRSAPSTTGRPEWDTFLATVVLWDLRKRGLDAPSWTDRPPLVWEWFVGYEQSTETGWREVVRSETPAEFLGCGILIREKSLGIR
ncbi:hypothetical protein B7R21_07650 [Subtercola boreus]|uniref:Uncharacterized protein n=1 Tax=Subtercola boreus TaxID=120213 RepID=A0A3E0VUR5_9MICO|nr:hypothetical protein [Subtercola boreus]RFA13814.1 hypothetical protein B7R21_07650 [Subtercola boreus]